VGYYNLEHRSDGEAFGFTVYRPASDRGPYADVSVPDECWAIGLPHQCDSWAIAMSEDRTAVLAGARRFRDELDQAIAELERG
jgi:hypothetical protein